MLQYIGKRILGQVGLLVASTLVVFFLLHIAPGNPATLLNGGHPPSAATIRYLDAKYALNRPLPIQYLLWISHILRGNLGESIAARTSVVSVLAPRLAVTAFLTAYAAVIMLVFGIGTGLLSGVFRSGATDFAATLGSLTLAAVPAYVTGVVLAVVFGVELAWLPALGGGGSGSFLTRLDYLTLPAIALGLSSLAIISRLTRAAAIAELESEHVFGARVRGLSESRIVLKHVLRGSLVPVITIAGAQIGYLLSGAIVVEYAFGLNGIGTLLVSSVEGKDYAVVQAVALLITAEFLTISLLVDLLYGLIDPRVRLSEGAG
jgi:peptide/nickel transport system permease protein